MPKLSDQERLNGDNYNTWCIQAKAILISDDHWEYVANEIKRENSADRFAWERRDRKAMAAIVNLLDPTQLKIIAHETTSSAIWLKLGQIFNSTGPTRLTGLIREVHGSRWKESDSVRDKLNDFFQNIHMLSHGYRVQRNGIINHVVG